MVLSQVILVSEITSDSMKSRIVIGRRPTVFERYELDCLGFMVERTIFVTLMGTNHLLLHGISCYRFTETFRIPSDEVIMNGGSPKGHSHVHACIQT